MRAGSGCVAFDAPLSPPPPLPLRADATLSPSSPAPRLLPRHLTISVRTFLGPVSLPWERIQRMQLHCECVLTGQSAELFRRHVLHGSRKQRRDRRTHCRAQSSVRVTPGDLPPPNIFARRFLLQLISTASRAEAIHGHVHACVEGTRTTSFAVAVASFA